MIPDFNIHGVLPPIWPVDGGASSDRSPYATDMATFCRRFATTPERRAILAGFLDLRQELRDVFGDGYQWVNGSFTEDVEQERGRPPGDVDVVTFAALGDDQQQQQAWLAHRDALDRRRCKARYKVDHIVVATDVALTEARARCIGSHRRDDFRWKGFLSLPLNSTDDVARAWLAQTGTAGSAS